MCGIAGIVSLDGERIDTRALQNMNDIQSHRGPDGEGSVLAWQQDGGFQHAWVPHTDRFDQGAPVRVGLAHRRLAIQDLSERGLQPMGSEDRRTWVVFNGEIYNFQILRPRLQALGHVFNTLTDTEVVLASYLEWGEECLAHLEGMFGFAIWDGRQARLFCARDRLGIKPFYYAVANGYFIFASEMKAVLTFPGITARPDDAAVLGFLTHGNCDYGERTLLQGVKSLPSAHSLTVDLPKRRWSVRRYWELRPQALNGTADGQRIAALRSLLTETTRRHLISDVPAGSCLSGGLDSSTVVSLVGKIRREQPESAASVAESFRTFTSCWKYAELDERDYALTAAHAVGADPCLVFPSVDDFWTTFPRMAWHQDMPFYSLSFYSQWCVMRAARQAGVKVLLDGQGGDEVFGGYAKFRYAYWASLLRSRSFDTMLQEVGSTLRHGDRYVFDIRSGYRYLPRRLRRLLKVDSMLQGALRADWDRALATEDTPATRWWRNALDGHARPSPGTPMQWAQVDDIVLDTLPALLRMEDRSSMAFSLEARVPLLDHKVVEFGISLPDRLKFQRGFSKFAVRKAMDRVMPDKLRLRTTKLGFASPDRVWLANDLRGPVTELLNGAMRSAKYVDPAALRRWYGSEQAKKANTDSYLGLFRVLSLEMWMRAFNLN
jgi:asparagine synthase (glutamine-hydrolysing)